MAELTGGDLDSLPVPLDFGPVLKSATQTSSKRVSKRAAASKPNGGARSARDAHTLTKKHPSVKHLYKCEQKHRWQWVPEKRLCSLWHSLENEERARLVQTHEHDQLTQRFCEELETQMRTVECYASESAKRTLAAMIWCDQSGLALFKRIFIIAVEQNHPMVIDMEVIAAVDAVIQSWTWLVGILAMAVTLHNVWRSLPPLDPRNFDVGSDLWLQYREREHVRLMWMSATVRVFEVRLLQILERRRRAAKQAEAACRSCLRSTGSAGAARPRVEAARGGSRASPECTDAPAKEALVSPKKHLGQRRMMRRRRLTAAKEEASNTEECEPLATAGVEGQEDPGDAAESDDAPAAACHSESPPPSEPALPTPEPEALGEGSEALVAEAAEGDFLNEDGGDEIDAEFARRVQEHFQNRVQAAGKDLHSQTDRGNKILKSLCEKLKTELERAAITA